MTLQPIQPAVHGTTAPEARARDEVVDAALTLGPQPRSWKASSSPCYTTASFLSHQRDHNIAMKTVPPTTAPTATPTAT
ncbi:hypothetical protein GCM10009854_44100 [Saccharopolyspora halophila]|uniref:Uncharacterized protein n=1 Tax=Saccharopolyspora halophila TaxID=405551 RepID=A0ABN3GST1_9PSEU